MPYNIHMDKELSWLAFNERVLQEAEDPHNPLVERIRFLGIYSSNRDEFYKVRFADLRRRRLISEALGVDTDMWLLNEVQQRIRQSNEKFDSLYNDLLLELARNQIFLLNESQISEAQRHWIKGYFRQSLRTLIFPILIEPDTSLVTFLRDEYTYLVVEMIQARRCAMPCWKFLPTRRRVLFPCLPIPARGAASRLYCWIMCCACAWTIFSAFSSITIPSRPIR